MWLTARQNKLFYPLSSFVAAEVLGSEREPMRGKTESPNPRAHLVSKVCSLEPKGLVSCAEISNNGHSNRWKRRLLGGLRGWGGVRGEGGRKFRALSTSLHLGQRPIFLHVLSAMGAAVSSPDRSFLIHWWELEDPARMLMWKQGKRLGECRGYSGIFHLSKNTHLNARKT